MFMLKFSFTAVHTCHNETLLLQNKFQTSHRSTPLLIAAEYGYLECAQLLIEHGADITKNDNDGDTVLHVSPLR